MVRCGMPETIKPNELRNNKRFDAHDGAMVMFVGPHANRVGQILNASMGGLAFTYAAGEAWPDQLSELHIVVPNKQVHLKDFSAKTIYDSRRADKLSVEGKDIRKRGVRFEELDGYQISQLQHFIRSHTYR
jgi:hypothetical protein